MYRNPFKVTSVICAQPVLLIRHPFEGFPAIATSSKDALDRPFLVGHGVQMWGPCSSVPGANLHRVHSSRLSDLAGSLSLAELRATPTCVLLSRAAGKEF